MAVPSLVSVEFSQSLYLLLSILGQFDDTPKAFANFSPRFELARTLGRQTNVAANAESVGEIPLRFANAFSVDTTWFA